jgi:hypothetical protein
VQRNAVNYTDCATNKVEETIPLNECTGGLVFRVKQQGNGATIASASMMMMMVMFLSVFFMAVM